MLPGLTNFQRYLLVIAHPDDEVHCGILLHRLVESSKQVRVVLLTSGDAGHNARGRAEEMYQSAAAIGLAPEDLVFLGIPEKELLAGMRTAYDQTMKVASHYNPECVISLDYDGGHEGHDAASLIAHQVSLKLGVPQVVFPDYHFRNSKRHGLEFVHGRKSDFILTLTDQEKDLKIRLLEAHRGQLGFYLRLQKYQENYFHLLFERELYRIFPERYDFLAHPAYQIGYEYHRNGFKFTNFVEAAKPLLDSIAKSPPR